VDNNGASYGEYYWARRSCRPYQGSYSAWAVGGGAHGSSKSCGTNYPDRADSWMIYGPFSLTDATDAELTFQLWLRSEAGYDGICWGASTDGRSFGMRCESGNSGGWTSRRLDLMNAPGLGNLTGRPNVWIALRFLSDGSINYPEGAYVDNLLLRKYVGAPPTPVPYTPVPVFTPTPSPTPSPCPNLDNGDFEQGPVVWTEYSQNGWDLILNSGWPGTVTPHSGVWAVWEGGDYNEVCYIEQRTLVPAATPYFRYYHWIASQDYCGYDFAYVRVNGVTVDQYSLCSANNTNGWAMHVVNLSAYANQCVTVQIRVTTDSSLNSNLFIDDVAFQSTLLGGQVIPLPFDPDTARPRSGPR